MTDKPMIPRDANGNIIPIKFAVLGYSGMGKSFSLANLREPEKVVIINGDKKQLPFISPMRVVSLGEPYELLSLMDSFETDDRYEVCVIDTFSFILNQFEDQIIMNAARSETRGLWAEYGKFAREVLSKLNDSKKCYIFMSHLMTEKNEDTGDWLTQAFCKGAAAKHGLEALLTTVLYAKNVPISRLKPNELLTITEEDEEDGSKFVFQTRKDKQSRNESMKALRGIFNREELYIDNDCQLVFDAVSRTMKG